MDSQPSKNLIVNFLPQDLGEKQLFDIFTTVGPIESCKVITDHQTGVSHCFGFVNFVRPQDAEKAIRQLNGLELSGKRMKVSYSRPNKDAFKHTSVYVKNLPKQYCEEDIDMLFCQYGKIAQKDLLVDKITGNSRGVAFVRMTTTKEAEDAIRDLDGEILVGSNEPLIVRIARDHRKTRAAYFAGLQAGLRQRQEMNYDFAERGQEEV